MKILLGLTCIMTMNVTEIEVDKVVSIEKNLNLTYEDIYVEDYSDARSACIFGTKDRYENNDKVSIATELVLEKERFQPYPNYYVNTGYDIADVDATLSKDPSICGGEIDVDYYTFLLPRKSNIEITLENIPAGADYDLYLYEESLSGYASAKSGNADELISRTMPASRYYIKVVSFSGYSNSSEYTLNIRAKEGGYKSYTPDEARANFGSTFFWQSDYSAPSSWERSYQNGGQLTDSMRYELYDKYIGYSYSDISKCTDSDVNTVCTAKRYDETKIYLTGETKSENGSVLNELQLFSAYLGLMIDDLEKQKTNGHIGQEIAVSTSVSLGCGAVAGLMEVLRPIAGTITCTAVGALTTLAMPEFLDTEYQFRLDSLNQLDHAIDLYTVSGDYNGQPIVISMQFIPEVTITDLGVNRHEKFRKVYIFDISELPAHYYESQGLFGGTFSRNYRTLYL